MDNKSSRLLPLDALRGFIIILMALDHANAFIARGRLESELWAGSFPGYHGDALLFLTRFITHLAAPGFFFLMGAGMSLFSASRRKQGWGNGALMGRFLVRGALLIALQFLLENPAWRLGNIVPEGMIYFGVLFALGGTMIVASLFLFLPQKWLLLLSGALILFTEALLQGLSEAVRYPPLARLGLVPGYTPGIYVLYPILPWLGVAGLGMAFGRWLGKDREAAYRGAAWLGAAGLAIFAILRLIGGYGNIRPPLGESWIDFFNLVKYPPSITFLALTLGVNLLLMSLFARLRKPTAGFLGFLGVYGRVPLFFYILHLYPYALMGLWIEPRGVGIQRMIPFWLLGLALLYPLCWAYGRFKNSRSEESVWRML